MKKLTATLCLTILVCLTSNSAWSEGFLCSNLGILCPKTVDKSRTVEREGLTYEVNSQTPFTGYTVTKFRNGQMNFKIQYKNGKENGSWVWYHSNGQVNRKGIKKDGKPEGLWLYYHKNGQLSGKGNWQNGTWDGLWVNYHENGKLSYKGTYKDGKKDGPWVGYNKDGTVWEKYTGTFKDGKKVK